MKKIILPLMVIMVLLALPVMAGNQGKDKGNGWVNYGNIKVEWTWDGSQYQYVWLQDRDLDGVYCEGIVEVDYGRYSDYFGGAPIYKTESCDYDADGSWGLIDNVKKEWTDKVVHLTTSWVPGVTVPGGENKYVVKDTDGDGIYEGGFSTVLFWDYVTIQGSPSGPYLIMNKFEEYYDMNDDGNGYYIEYQYMHIPEE